ncbi:hypothetical protein FRB93_012338 [Tulasnella sp. JGI-2019a]|nr:hypothetical protein FRB93_012338 [Tulasnella sp. JGI-2019a]
MDHSIALDRLRRDAAVHQPRIELIWASFISLWWLASAMLVSLELRGFPKCSVYRGLTFGWNHQSEESWCKLNYAIEWLLWAGFILSFGTVIGIIVFAYANFLAGFPHVWDTAMSDFERRPGPKSTSDSRRSSRRHSARIRDLETTLSQLSSQPSQLQLQQQRLGVITQEERGDNSPSPSAFPRPPSPTLSVASAMRALGYSSPRRDNASTRATAPHHYNSSNSLLDTPPPRPPYMPRSGELQDSLASLQSGTGGTAP